MLLAENLKDADGTSDDMMQQDFGRELWADKYCSQKYFDLLTDDSVNRKALTWLKSWDHVINPDLPKLNLAPPDLHPKKEYAFW